MLPTRQQGVNTLQVTGSTWVTVAMTLKAAWTIRTRYGGDAMKAAHFLGLLPPKATSIP